MKISRCASRFLAAVLSLLIAFPGGAAFARESKAPAALSGLHSAMLGSSNLERPRLNLPPGADKRVLSLKFGAIPAVAAPDSILQERGAAVQAGEGKADLASTLLQFDANQAAAEQTDNAEPALALQGLGTHFFDGKKNDRSDNGGAGGGSSGPNQPGGSGNGDNGDYPSQAPILGREEPLFPHQTIKAPIPASGDTAAEVKRLIAAGGGYVVITTKSLDKDFKTPAGHYPLATLARMTLVPSGDKLLFQLEGLREVQINGYSGKGKGVAEVGYPEIDRDPQLEISLAQDIDQLVHILGAENGGPFKRAFDIIHSDLELEVVANQLAAAIPFTPEEKQMIFGALSVPGRLTAVQNFLMAQAQEQGLAPQQEDAQAAGEADSDLPKLKAAYKKIKDGMTPEAQKIAERELARLAKMPPQAAEHHVIIDYLNVLFEMPWTSATKDNDDLNNAQSVMDADHYGLAKVKEAILEHLAVRQDVPNGKGMILAFDGPPGVGKTSLGQSIARALGRKFTRVPLGGVHDEADIRGHRRTYVGAAPGRIVEALRRIGVNNPVMQLDELDKLGNTSGGHNGNPEAAMLEVLDPEQNNTFRDHYLGVDFDLSHILFLVTSNELEKISAPLQDRLEVINISGYTAKEKLEIAKRHLVEKRLKANGFKAGEVKFTEDALHGIITGYTRESGVRNLERSIGIVLRRLKKRMKTGVGAFFSTVEAANLKDLLGPARFGDDKGLSNGVGVASGLYWSSVGGGVLNIETSALPKGTGKGFSVSGSLKEVMTESAELSRQNAVKWAIKQGVDPAVFTTYDFSVHVPDGATPKDGPSAGTAMFTALASLFTGRPVRQGVALTGEITLTGQAWPIGGLKEKSLGALEKGYTELIVPEGNRKDYEELPEEVRQKIKFHFVTNADQVADIALEKTGAPMQPYAAKTAGATAPAGFRAWLRGVVNAILG